MKHIIVIITCLLLSLFSTGQNVFQRTYGCTGYNYGKCAYQTDDGGYIILGDKSGFVGNTAIYLVKTDTLGKIEWDKAIGGTEVDWANDMKITHDKGFIIAGYTDVVPSNGYDVLLVKTDSSGNVLWEKTYGGTDWDMGYSVVEDKDHNFVIAGETYSYSYGDADVYLIKTDSIGDTIWTKHYGGAGADIAYSIDTLKNSGYIVAGVTQRAGDTTCDGYLLRIKKNGDTLWTRKYGGILNDKFYCARQIDDTSYIMCGETQDYGAINYDQWIIKTDTLGNIRWPHISVNSGNEGYYDIKRSWKNGLVAIGYTTTWGAGESDVAGTIMTNAAVDIEGHTFGGAYDDIAYSVNLTKDSCYIYTGTTESFGLGITNIYFIKTDKNGVDNYAPVQETGINEAYLNQQGNSFTIYPNPTNDLLNIKSKNITNGNILIKIIDAIGSEVFVSDDKKTNAYFSKTINMKALNDGIYFIQISTNNKTSVSKIIKQSFK